MGDATDMMRLVGAGEVAGKHKRGDWELSREDVEEKCRASSDSEAAEGSSEESDTDEDEDLEMLMMKLTTRMGVSRRAQRAVAKKFRKADLTEQIAIVAGLEKQLKTKKEPIATTQTLSNNQNLRLHRPTTPRDWPEPEEEQYSSDQEEENPAENDALISSKVEDTSRPDNPLQEAQDNEYSFESAPTKAEQHTQEPAPLSEDDFWSGKQADEKEVDRAWEELLNKSLPGPKQELLRQQYYNEPDPEKRFHIYMEFSSYLRPPSEATKAYRAMMRTEGKVEDDLKDANRNPITRRKLPSGLEAHGDGFPESWPSSVFAIAAVMTLLLRFFLL